MYKVEEMEKVDVILLDQLHYCYALEETDLDKSEGKGS